MGVHLPAGVLERFVSAGGFRTRYLEAGDPTCSTVLLLHDGAWGASSDVTWGRVIPELARDHHVLAPDQLGFGGTDKVVFTDRASFTYRIDHVRDFLEAVGQFEKVHVVGNSFGGTLGLRALPYAGLPARSVVSIAGGGGPWRTPRSRELQDWDGTAESLGRIVRLLTVDDFDDFDEHVALRMHWASQPGHYRAVAAVGVPLPPGLRAAHFDDWPAPLADVQTPVLLVRGADDLLLEPEWTSRLLAVLPDAREIVVPGRHAPNIDDPHATADLIREHLRAVDASVAADGPHELSGAMPDAPR